MFWLFWFPTLSAAAVFYTLSCPDSIHIPPPFALLPNAPPLHPIFVITYPRALAANPYHPLMDSSSSFSSSRSYTGTNTGVTSSRRDPDKDLYILLDPDKFRAPHLANIEEDYPMFMPPLKSFPAPESPLEPMEFLSRSWSILSVDVARSLQSKSQHSLGSLRTLESGPQHTSLEDPTLGAPFTFASTLTSQMVMDRLMAPGPSSVSLPCSRAVSVCGLCPCVANRLTDLLAWVPGGITGAN